jgi:ribosomal protein S27AE
VSEGGYTTKRLTAEDAAEIAELLRVSIDDKHFLAWHPRLREIREKMIERLGDIEASSTSTPAPVFAFQPEHVLATCPKCGTLCASHGRVRVVASFECTACGTAWSTGTL